MAAMSLEAEQDNQEEASLIKYLESISPNKLRLFIESVKRMQRLRLKLHDPLSSMAAPYNKDAGNGTLRQLVQRTEEFAATCVDSYATFQTSRGYGFVQKESMDAMIPILHSSVNHALSEFYVDLSCLLSDCCGEENDHLASSFLVGIMDMKDILECCYQVARNNIRRKLHLWEVD